ncbi:MAG: polysaccharide deacetylase family protein [SAR324 cluster bacterium]|nr:polysaccharide deacetylase family protein [SAR324 cluster bacterium]
MPNPWADYSPIVDRKPLKLPGNARVAVWTVINVEDWDINQPMPRTLLPYPQGVTVIPDVTNFGWFEYGLRVGFWRMKAVLDQAGIRATVSLNASVCDNYPRLVDLCLEARWELLAHGYAQRPLFLEEDERNVIRRTLARIGDYAGKKPRGWMGPGLGETWQTPQVLADEGVEYLCDWCNDDQPYPMKVKDGSLVSIPYTVENNDIPLYLIRNQPSSAIFDQVRDTFDTLYREGAENARVMAISTHPYITGVPHRIKYYEKIFEYIRRFEGVVFMTGEEILDWYKSVS